LVQSKSGNVGIGTKSPTEILHVGGNIYASGTVTQGSSRKLKERIRDLASGDALAAVRSLKPTRFYYKTDKNDEHLGFIAEEVPALLATKDRKGVNAMDVAAILTKVVQAQQSELKIHRTRIADLEKERTTLEERLSRVERVLAGHGVASIGQ